MFFTLVIVLVSAVYLYLRYIYMYWKRHNFPSLVPSIPFGNLGLVARRKESFGGCLYELYKQSTLPFVGIYMMFKPVVLVRDASLARRMLSADFNSFHDRGVYCNPRYDPLSENLFAMHGHRWRMLRAKLSPTFTSGKLKNMLATIDEQGDRLLTILSESAAKAEVFEMKDVLSRYALNVIGSVIFGVDVDTLANPKHAFREIDKRITNSDLINVFKGAATFLCPKVLEFFNINSMPDDVQKFMIDIVQTQIDYREKNNVSRKDFIQFLIQLRKTDNDFDADATAEVEEDTLKSLTVEQCAAQVFLFYVAGFDTTAATTSYTLFELARNHELMHRVQAEIDAKLAKYNGVLTYECLQEMEYTEMCILESIRKYPALPILNRECNSDYALPDSKLIIEKGTMVIISLLGISRDPAYFPEPMLYRPERFSDDPPAYNADAYMPFGDGPRACIGLRLGKLAVKIALVKVLQRFDVEAIDRKELEFDTYGVTLQIKGGINMRVTERQHSTTL